MFPSTDEGVALVEGDTWTGAASSRVGVGAPPDRTELGEGAQTGGDREERELLLERERERERDSRPVLLLLSVLSRPAGDVSINGGSRLTKLSLLRRRWRDDVVKEEKEGVDETSPVECARGCRPPMPNLPPARAPPPNLPPLLS